MAYTQIHAVKATLDKAIAYISNAKKTNEKILISSYACAPQTASFDFASTLAKSGEKNPILAYHLIQSFAPGEVSPKEAHEIGRQLASKLLEGKYAYVLSTHIDKNHVHNHIIFCAANFVDYGKFHSCKKSNYLIRRLSDDLCREHGLSVIVPGQRKGQKYNEWQASQKGSSIREALKNDIDRCLMQSTSYPMFLDLLKANGIEVKGETFGEGSLKYISFRPAGTTQFFRGCARTFGEGYTKEELAKRIMEKSKKRTASRKSPFTEAPVKTLTQTRSGIKTITLEELLMRKSKTLSPKANDRLIDITTEKMLSSPGLLAWAKKQNLQTLSHLYANTKSLDSLRGEIEGKKQILEALTNSLSALEEKLLPAGEITHTASVCRENLRYVTSMNKSKDPDRYYRAHADKLTLFHSAKHILEDRYGLKIDTLDFEQIATRFAMMQGKKGALLENIKCTKEEIQDLEYALMVLENYLYPSRDINTSSQQHKSDQKDKPQRRSDRPI